MPLLLFLLACSDGSTDSAAVAPPPTVEWLVPSEGDVVVAGEVDCALLIDGFSLQAPTKHEPGASSGYLVVTVDGTDALTSGDTNFSLSLAAGARTLAATLYYDDGDVVTATRDALCGESDEDASCAPVTASIGVTAE